MAPPGKLINKELRLPAGRQDTGWSSRWIAEPRTRHSRYYRRRELMGARGVLSFRAKNQRWYRPTTWQFIFYTSSKIVVQAFRYTLSDLQAATPVSATRFTDAGASSAA